MKVLLINGKQALIDINQYFPFTYKISDLEEINIINFPSTKSVMLPRNTQNDELFGHIAEITRINYGYQDNKVGVSFNQFKKGTYELINNSEVISKGIIRIVNITEDFYEVELYDESIDLLEELEDKHLDELEIINPLTSLPLSERINFQTIKSMVESDWGITPIFVDYESKYTGSKIYGNLEGVGEKILELPREMTPLQMRTFSAADIPFTIHITKMMDMIEGKHNIRFSPYVKKLLAYVHMLLREPKNNLASKVTELQSNTATKNANDKDTLVWHNYNWLEVGAFWYRVFNGEYQVKYEYDFKVETTQAGNIITHYDGANNTTDNTTEGAYIGTLGVSTSIGAMDGGFTKDIFTKIPLYLDRNAFYTKDGNKRTLHLKGSFITSMNIYQKLKVGSLIRVYHTFSGRRWGAGSNVYKGKDLNFFGFIGDSGKFTVASKVTPTVTHKHLDFSEYDLLDSKKLLPSMSVKDFIIDLSKTYNFDITIKDEMLYVDVKRYKVTSDLILLEDNINIDVSKVNFSRLEIKSGVSQSPLIDEYEEEYNTWASKIINTGYTIKKEEEEIELPYRTPFALTDYNYFAYDLYGMYLNGGYARYPVGNIKGLEGDNLVLGYLGINDETMYVADAEYIEDDFIISNKKLTRQTGESGIEWVFNEASNIEVATLESYPTFIPYRFRDGNIIESLEVNKPHYNFANITDALYPESTTLYNRFHKNMLEDKYSANTHVLSAKMFIDGLQDIYKIYNYKNSNYIISELVEYDPTEPNMYEVKLMRVNNTDSYTTIPALPPKAPKDYNNTLKYIVTSTFNGDVRHLGNRLGGHEVQLLTSIDSEPFTINLDISSLVPNFSYKNGKTKVVTSHEYKTIWDADSVYKFKTQLKLRYRPEGSTGQLLSIPDSGVVTLTNTGNSIGATLNDTRVVNLTMGTTPSTDILTTPIKLDNFRKLSVIDLGSSYEVMVEYTLTNGTSELHNYDVSLTNLTALGSTVPITNYDKYNIVGGIRIVMRVVVTPALPLMDPLETIDIKMKENFESKAIRIYNGGNSIQGTFANTPEAVGEYAIFSYRNMTDITGNTTGSGATTVRYEGTIVTYFNSINRI